MIVDEKLEPGSYICAEQFMTNILFALSISIF